ncbi:hypothetical protein GWK47_053663 [Chionoecetes opilio]|uniref:Uncharacterized protein n=1 Tax=Chionoecetes opilio TaxID=41210 RepID=A0A8J4Y587_CHIOP|nr:hypothetical protein GWK47_053663 [Chionoecetes opilio]
MPHLYPPLAMRRRLSTEATRMPPSLPPLANATEMSTEATRMPPSLPPLANATEMSTEATRMPPSLPPLLPLMDKSREGDRGDKSHAGLPPGMDPATAALYANMFGSSSLGAFNPAAQGMQGWGGLQHGFPPTSSAAGLASLAAAQQAQQAQAVLAGLGPAAAAYQDRALGGESTGVTVKYIRRLELKRHKRHFKKN